MVDPLYRALGDDRSDYAGRRCGGVAKLQFADSLGKLTHEFVGNTLIDHETLGRHADLPLIQERAEYCGIHCAVDIGILQHYERSLATQLQQTALEMGRTGFGDHAADLGGAREVDPAHGIVGHQRFGDSRCVFGRGNQEIEHTRRQACLNEGIGHKGMSARTVFRAFEDHGIAARQRIRDSASPQDHRPIPRHNAQHGAHRLAKRQRESAKLIGWNRLTLDLSSERCSLAQQIRRCTYVELRPELRCANFLSHDPAEFRHLGLEDIRCCEQETTPLGRSGLGPFAECSLG
ncbi:hypothetical protein D9M71_503720 [compost metagenome]